MERSEFAEIAQRNMGDFFASPPTHNFFEWAIRVTSGTTQTVPLVFVSHFEPPAFSRYASVNSPVVCFGSMCSRLTNALFAVHAQGTGISHALFLDNKDIGLGLRDIFAEQKPDSFFGFTSFVARAAEWIDAHLAVQVKFLFLAGERLTPELEVFFKEKFPNAAISMTYIANELGQITKPICAHQPRNHYHPAEGVVIEIDTPDHTGAGDIMVTKKIYRGMQVTRYKTGDIGRIREEACACGASQTLEVVGRRGNDYIKLAGALLFREEFDRVAKNLSLFDDYRVDARTDEMRGSLRMKVYRKDGVGTLALAQEIADRFSREVYLTPTQTLSELVEKDLFLPLSLEFVERPFPIQNKEVKIRLMP